MILMTTSKVERKSTDQKDNISLADQSKSCLKFLRKSYLPNHVNSEKDYYMIYLTLPFPILASQQTYFNLVKENKLQKNTI